MPGINTNKGVGLFQVGALLNPLEFLFTDSEDGETLQITTDLEDGEVQVITFRD